MCDFISSQFLCPEKYDVCPMAIELRQHKCHLCHKCPQNDKIIQFDGEDVSVMCSLSDSAFTESSHPEPSSGS